MSELTSDQARMIGLLKETGKVTVRISCHFLPGFKDGRGKTIPHHCTNKDGKLKNACNVSVKWFEELIELGFVKSIEVRDRNERGLEYKKTRVYTLTASGIGMSLSE